MAKIIFTQQNNVTDLIDSTLRYKEFTSHDINQIIDGDIVVDTSYSYDIGYYKNLIEKINNTDATLICMNDNNNITEEIKKIQLNKLSVIFNCDYTNLIISHIVNSLHKKHNLYSISVFDGNISKDCDNFFKVIPTNDVKQIANRYQGITYAKNEDGIVPLDPFFHNWIKNITINNLNYEATVINNTVAKTISDMDIVHSIYRNVTHVGHFNAITSYYDTAANKFKDDLYSDLESCKLICNDDYNLIYMTYYYENNGKIEGNFFKKKFSKKLFTKYTTKDNLNALSIMSIIPYIKKTKMTNKFYEPLDIPFDVINKEFLTKFNITI